jgi:hypothetical protein
MKRTWCSNTIQISDSQPFPTMTTFLNSLNRDPKHKKMPVLHNLEIMFRWTTKLSYIYEKSYIYIYTHTHTHILLIQYSKHSNAEKPQIMSRPFLILTVAEVRMHQSSSSTLSTLSLVLKWSRLKKKKTVHTLLGKAEEFSKQCLHGLDNPQTCQPKTEFL